MWRGTRDDCLNNMVKYEKWVFSHLLQAGNCKRCRWKMTEEEFDQVLSPWKIWNNG